MKPTIKQLLALFLALCLVFCLAACADKSEPTPSSTITKAPTSSADTAAPETPAPEAEWNGFVGDYLVKEEAAGEAKYGYSMADGAIGSVWSADMSGSAKGMDSEPAVPAPVPGDADTPLPVAPDEPGDPIAPVEPGVELPEPTSPVEPLKLTAAEWKDNDNWPFFANLVNAGTISFPSFGLDPRNRIKVTLTDAESSPLGNAPVALYSGDTLLWTAKTGMDGTAYLFYTDGVLPDRVVSGEAEAAISVEEKQDDPQSKPSFQPVEDVTLIAAPAAPQTGMQILFIVDTTGSMGDELAYLQKDFSAIAARVGSENIQYSASFYRDEGDEYVTRHSGFASDVAEIQQKINAEYADGGGDAPEAVAQVLTECLVERTDWDENSAKLAFLIFDAPPHEGTEDALLAAVRAAAEKGIHLVPVVASNADRNTELFGRALAILTNGTYVFLTNDSGIGDSHLEPIVGSYNVELLQDLIVRIIEEYKP